MSENLIVDNKVQGVTIWGGSPTLANNAIYKNPVNITLKNHTGGGCKSNVVATNNYWGTTSQEEIQAGIYDQKMDFQLGTVLYEPVLEKPPVTIAQIA